MMCVAKLNNFTRAIQQINESISPDIPPTLMAVAVALDDDGWHAQAGLVLNRYKKAVLRPKSTLMQANTVTNPTPLIIRPKRDVAEPI